MRSLPFNCSALPIKFTWFQRYTKSILRSKRLNRTTATKLTHVDFHWAPQEIWVWKTFITNKLSRPNTHFTYFWANSSSGVVRRTCLLREVVMAIVLLLLLLLLKRTNERWRNLMQPRIVVALHSALRMGFWYVVFCTTDVRHKSHHQSVLHDQHQFIHSWRPPGKFWLFAQDNDACARELTACFCIVNNTYSYRICDNIENAFYQNCKHNSWFTQTHRHQTNRAKHPHPIIIIPAIEGASPHLTHTKHFFGRTHNAR